MDKKLISFTLIDNAKDSLYHAVEHLTNPDGIMPTDLKHAIRDVSHVIELLLKERLRQIHPAFIWQNIDEYPSKDAKTVGVGKAIARLFKLADIALTEDYNKTISICKKIRDSIEHYEFQINEKEAKVIIGRMLSFIFNFSKRYLDLDLEKEFRSDDRWKLLLDLWWFWEAHSTALEKQLSEQEKPVWECPSCHAMTFDISESECVLCGHRDELIECDGCHNMIFESEAETFSSIEGDEETGAHEEFYTLCNDCIEREIAEDAAIDSMRDEY